MPWVYDPGHSQITWSVNYVGLSLVHGMFTKIDCDLDVDGDDPRGGRRTSRSSGKRG